MTYVAPLLILLYLVIGWILVRVFLMRWMCHDWGEIRDADYVFAAFNVAVWPLGITLGWLCMAPSSKPFNKAVQRVCRAMFFNKGCNKK